MADEPEIIETAPPETHPDTGVAMAGEYPFNMRLRAEAMARAGVTHDDADIVTDELIADTAARLKREDADERVNKPSMAWSRADLIAHAETIGLTVEGDANKAAILDQITAKEG